MMKWMKSRRILAAVLAAGLVLGTQGMTAVTAYAGPGAARPVQGGPGAAAEQGQTGSQGESDPAAEPAGQEARTPQIYRQIRRLKNRLQTVPQTFG